MGKKNDIDQVKNAIPTELYGFEPELMLLGSRIRAVRTRTEQTAEAFGKLMGVSKPTQLAYENGKRAPDAVYLYRLADQHGSDLAHLVTGQDRRSLGLNQAEQEFIDRLRAIPPKMRRTVEDVLLLAFLAFQDRPGYPK